MTVQLNQSDFQKLSSIVQALPDFRNVKDRQRLVANALEGVPQADVVLSRLDLDGTPMAVSGEIIRFLADFGRVAYGKEALGVFLNYIKPFVGNENSEFILSLFSKYPLDIPDTPNRLIGLWKGEDSIDDVREKIIGENTLKHVYILELAIASAKAVVHIQTSEGYGTGFMISPNLLMTNNHVIGSRKKAKKSQFNFNYQIDLDGKECQSQAVSSLLENEFHTNLELDYTVLTLDKSLNFGKPLKLLTKQMYRDNRVSIIQHPGGGFKKISMQNNFIEYADANVIQYTTSTLPGSSGSPVFDESFNVVAIHHSGGFLSEPNTNQKFLRNAGTTMTAILEDLKNNATNIYHQIGEWKDA